MDILPLRGVLCVHSTFSCRISWPLTWEEGGFLLGYLENLCGEVEFSSSPVWRRWKFTFGAEFPKLSEVLIPMHVSMLNGTKHCYTVDTNTYLVSSLSCRVSSFRVSGSNGTWTLSGYRAPSFPPRHPVGGVSLFAYPPMTTDRNNRRQSARNRLNTTWKDYLRTWQRQTLKKPWHEPSRQYPCVVYSILICCHHCISLSIGTMIDNIINFILVQKLTSTDQYW